MGTPSREKLTIVLIILISLSLISLVGGISVKAHARNFWIHHAESQIGAIYNACKIYQCDPDAWPVDVDELWENGYVSVDEAVRRNWLFKINGRESISAKPTEENLICQGYKICYEIQKCEFVLYKNDNELKRWM